MYVVSSISFNFFKIFFPIFGCFIVKVHLFTNYCDLLERLGKILTATTKLDTVITDDSLLNKQTLLLFYKLVSRKTNFPV